MRFHLHSAADSLSEKRRYLLGAYLLASAAYFSVQFVLLQNWDMQVRILIADHLFHGGSYFEPERELLESLIIGVFSFPLGRFAVYGYFLAADLLLFLAIIRFCRQFAIDDLVAIVLILNPFFLMYAVMNGSEIFLISFLILTVAEIRRGSYLGGVFFALSFLSKYDALYFALLFLFYFAGRKPFNGLKLFVANGALFVATLIPYLLYNLLTYGNIFYTFALSYLNFGISVGRLPYFVYQGLLELLLPLAALIWIAQARRWSLAQLLKGRLGEVLLIMVAFLIGLYTYYKAHNLMVHGLGTYRWGLIALSFALLFVAMLVTRQDLPLVVGASIVFFAAAALLVLVSEPGAAAGKRQARAAVSAFREVYGTSRCTVLSNDWVPLDYNGLPAAPIPHYEQPYAGHPIVSLGRTATGYPLVYGRGNVYIYGDPRSCTFSPVNVNFLDRTNAILRHERRPEIAASPCFWLFGLRPSLPSAERACSTLNGFLAKAAGVPRHR